MGITGKVNTGKMISAPFARFNDASASWKAVRPEEVLDFELGVDLNTPRLALQANLYAMEFTNEAAWAVKLVGGSYWTSKFRS